MYLFVVDNNFAAELADLLWEVLCGICVRACRSQRTNQEGGGRYVMSTTDQRKEAGLCLALPWLKARYPSWEGGGSRSMEMMA